MRVAGLAARLEALGQTVTDGGNIAVAIAETKSFGETNARYLREITDTCTKAAEAVIKTLGQGVTPIVVVVHDSVAAGTVSGVSESLYRRQDQKIGLIWIDAHSDINTPDTSPSGNVHGMPLAALLGLGPEPLSNTWILAEGPAGKYRDHRRRDIDAAEKENIRRAGVTEVYTMRDIDDAERP